nr:putative pentatricopeptide repeat-containing protein At1g12700, mitochondrial [Coffea arabica]
MKNHYSSVFPLVRDMCVKGMVVDECTLNVVINCYCLVGRVDLGFSVLGGFFKRGIVPNVVTFNTPLRGLFQEHKALQAHELFKKIIYEKLCEPDEVTSGIVIRGLCQKGNTGTAIDFLRAMEKQKRPCKPNAIIYSTIIDSLCKDKMVDEALALLQVYNIVPDVITFSIVVDALCKEGHIEDADEIVQIMIQQGQNPDRGTHSSLMDGYCLQKRIDDARRVFNTMVASGLTPDLHSYGILINAYSKTKKVEAAMNLFREIRHQGLTPNIVIYNTVLQGLFSSRRHLSA